MTHLDDMLPRLTQSDIVHRRHLDPEHRAYIQDFEVYIEVEDAKGNIRPIALSRQRVVFCVERRKAWRMLQSRSGIVNQEHFAQQDLLEKVDDGEIAIEDLKKYASDLFHAQLEALTAHLETNGLVPQSGAEPKPGKRAAVSS